MPTSDTAKPLRRFIKVITMTRTKKTRKEKVAGARSESRLMGRSENSSSPMNMVTTLMRLSQGPLK